MIDSKFSPQFESTSFQTKEDVCRNADAFLQCAKFSLNHSCLSNSEFINASLVNSCLSLELYLKSVLLVREFQPYALSSDDIDEMNRCTDVERKTDPKIQITMHHSKLVFNSKGTHHLFELFKILPVLCRDSIYEAVIKKGGFICKNDIDLFFEGVSKHFVNKRYAHEQFYLSDIGDYNTAKKVINLIDLIAPIIVQFNKVNNV
ncbi:hypothetical protein [Cedecea lapagei]|uniref:hypothetical protein n=1 Tax=Cedecea lapagei TaxID=158823 RepID=UPI001BD08AAA|nr:hypothetical protein [Cedecea lapagei]